MKENKSILFFSKRAHNKHCIIDIIKVKPDSLLLVYLGIPLSQNKLKARYLVLWLSNQQEIITSEQ